LNEKYHSIIVVISLPVKCALTSLLIFFIIINAALFSIYWVCKKNFNNPYFITIRFLCIANISLLLVIFVYSQEGSIIVDLVAVYFDECLGYSQISYFNVVICVNRFLAVVFYGKYKIWVTHKRMWIVLIFGVFWNVVR